MLLLLLIIVCFNKYSNDLVIFNYFKFVNRNSVCNELLGVQKVKLYSNKLTLKNGLKKFYVTTKTNLFSNSFKNLIFIKYFYKFNFNKAN